MSQGMGSRGPVTRRETADKLRTRFDWLQRFTDNELREITYCTTGEVMQGDEVYFDLSNPERGEIPGETGVEIPEGSCLVPRSEVPQRLWDKLVGPYQ